MTERELTSQTDLVLEQRGSIRHGGLTSSPAHGLAGCNQAAVDASTRKARYCYWESGEELRLGVTQGALA